jgi:hypothetical protein
MRTPPAGARGFGAEGARVFVGDRITAKATALAAEVEVAAGRDGVGRLRAADRDSGAHQLPHGEGVRFVTLRTGGVPDTIPDLMDGGEELATMTAATVNVSAGALIDQRASGWPPRSSFWVGLIILLVGLIAFGGFARGKWY